MTDLSIHSSGRRWLLRSLWGVVGFVIVTCGWVVVEALRNPDVRSRRPAWLDQHVAFDVAFWTPLLLTVLVGGGVVGFILWRAFRRMQSGTDLFAQRYGQGVRRRGESHLEEVAKPPSSSIPSSS